MFLFHILRYTTQKHTTEKLTLKLGWIPLPRFFGLKFSRLDQLPNAFAQLFLDNEDIF